MDNSKQSWSQLVATAGMRRRLFLSVFIGLFTQMSGNTLLSYYSNVLFEMMGFTSKYAKSRINIANQCWSLANASVIAIYVARFRRRLMFLISSSTMLLIFLAMTVTFEKLQEASDKGFTNNAAQIAALVWYFTYSATYNIGNNSLTYSTPFSSLKEDLVGADNLCSLPCGTLALRYSVSRYWCRAGLRQAWRFLLDLRQPACYGCHRLEVHGSLHRMARLREHLHLVVLP